MRRNPGNRSALIVALLAGLLLAACTEEGPGPQFANDPRPTRVPTEIAASPLASPALLPTSLAAVATPASFADLLNARGAVPTVFVSTGDDVWSVSSDGDAERLFEAPADVLLRAIDSSPSAEQVAVLLEPRSGNRQQAEVVFLDLEGEIGERIIASGATSATPVTGTGISSQTIDWSPQGDRVLVSFPSGTIAEAQTGADETVAILNRDGEPGSIIGPAWSPTGESIAFVAEAVGGASRSLRLLETDDGTVTNVVSPPDGRLVVDFAWMPDGASLLFTEGGDPDSATTGIDLWRVDVNGKNRELVASAGTVAPVARITSLSPSPDGRSVAYTVLVPGPMGPQLDSLWVRDLDSNVGFRIPLPSVAVVENIWWTNQGVILSVVTTQTAQGRPPTQALLQLRQDGTMTALWAAPAAVGTPPSGTPVAAGASTQASLVDSD